MNAFDCLFILILKKLIDPITPSQMTELSQLGLDILSKTTFSSKLEQQYERELRTINTYCKQGATVETFFMYPPAFLKEHWPSYDEIYYNSMIKLFLGDLDADNLTSNVNEIREMIDAHQSQDDQSIAMKDE